MEHIVYGAGRKASEAIGARPETAVHLGCGLDTLSYSPDTGGP